MVNEYFFFLNNDKNGMTLYSTNFKEIHNTTFEQYLEDLNPGIKYSINVASQIILFDPNNNTQ